MTHCPLDSFKDKRKDHLAGKMEAEKVFAAICGIKNSGKTTLIEQILRELTARGLRAAVIKHDGHDFTCDLPGTDSFRYVEAGACGAAVFSGKQLFLRKKGNYPDLKAAAAAGETPPASAFLKQLAGAFPDVDVLLLEGGKELPVRKIEVVRSGISSAPSSNPQGRFLIVSDLPEKRFGERTLPFESVKEIADAILEKETGGTCPADGKTTGSCSDSRQPDREERAIGMKQDMKQEMEQDFTHFDTDGRARMVDVGDKGITRRTAVAEGRVLVSPETFRLIRSGGMKKGDVLGTAQIAGIMGAKRTSDLIPMCHPLFLSGIRLQLTLHEEDCAVDIRAEVSCEGRTGVEMEALTAVSTAALTVYDMCKAVQRDIRITDIHLVEKTGGVHGDYRCKGECICQ